MMPLILEKNNMDLNELFADVPEIKLTENIKISSVQIDSRQVAQNDLFIALPGGRHHGLSFLSQVVEAGATCIVFDVKEKQRFAEQLESYHLKIKQFAVTNVREVAGVIIARYFQSVSQSMQLIAITGTDGKTSVSRFIAQALSAANSNSTDKIAVLGTTGNGIWGELKAATHTTADVLSMHQMLFSLAQQSAKTVVMEVSSHGIDQQRIAGLDIDTAVLTNVTRDHLDYHGNEENYRAVKKQLFHLPCIKNIVVNLDDQVGLALLKELQDHKQVYGYSLETGKKLTTHYINAQNIVADAQGFIVTVDSSLGEFELRIPLLGRFNISNSFAVFCVLLVNELPLASILSCLQSLTTAPGRMELFTAQSSSNKLPKVIVDYAHTPQALELSLMASREHFAGKLWCVFGCGGDRDQGKRALMGSIAEKLADHVILTDDNPRNENSDDIIAQILSGFTLQNKAQVITDRQQAITSAIQQASANDVVLIAGKGHEEYQLIGSVKKEFSDRRLVANLLGVALS